MGRGIGELGQAARREAGVREILLSHPPDRALAELRADPRARGFLDQLAGFLATNGHRALKEFELRSVRWEENPAPVLGMIRNYLLIDSDPGASEARTAELRNELIGEIRRKLGRLPFARATGVRWRLLAFAAARVRYYLKLRENSRFYHIMAFGILRKKVIRIEAELLRSGKLRCKDDIFFLLLEEVADLQADRLGWLDVEERIRERRIAHIRLSKMSPPKTIGLELPRSQPVQGGEADGMLLRGESASPGCYQGPARVILDPSTDAELRPGEVLVAPYTDPAWTPLFLTAGAAVVEIGSYLSHAGTVAREFGMPCVVDVAEATQRIRTGDRIEVDGETGTVRVLAPEARA
jgi:pyruvate,water dikinase